MSVAEAQIINKLLTEKDYSILTDNYLTEEYFPQFGDEYRYIKEFYEKYKCVPDKETFTSKFMDFQYFNVGQNIASIVGELREQNLFQRGVGIINGMTEIFEQDANKGVEYLLSHINELQPTYNIPYTDIMHDRTRLEEWKQRQKAVADSYIPLPFKEMEKILFGYKRGEELFVWLARSGIGKTQILSMSIEASSKAGFRVAVVSPELKTSTLGYRVDASRTHLSNIAMQRGLLLKGYEEYFDTICSSNEHIFVADSEDFGDDITVQQCGNFVKETKADILFIDGIHYVKPDGWNPKMNMTDSLGKAGQQLIKMSIKEKIPVVGVIQAQKTNGHKQDEEDILDTTNIFGSYQFGWACTRLVSINRIASALKMVVAKNRYGEETINNKSNGFLYNFDFDKMVMTYIPDIEDIKKDDAAKEDMEKAKDEFKKMF